MLSISWWVGMWNAECMLGLRVLSHLVILYVSCLISHWLSCYNTGFFSPSPFIIEIQGNKESQLWDFPSLDWLQSSRRIAVFIACLALIPLIRLLPNWTHCRPHTGPFSCWIFSKVIRTLIVRLHQLACWPRFVCSSCPQNSIIYQVEVNPSAHMSQGAEKHTSFSFRSVL